MTITNATSLLYLFRTKIEEAVALVPGMGAEEKLKAVQFWNVVSEKLQEIVNNSAADINALALKLDEENIDKMTFDLENGSQASIITQNDICSSDYVNDSSNYTVHPDSDYRHLEVQNSDLEQFLAPNQSVKNFSHSSLSTSITVCNNNYKQHSNSITNEFSEFTLSSNNSLELSSEAQKTVEISVKEKLISLQSDISNKVKTNCKLRSSQKKRSCVRTAKRKSNTKVPNSNCTLKPLKNEFSVPSSAKSADDFQSSCDKELLQNVCLSENNFQEKDLDKSDKKLAMDAAREYFENTVEMKAQSQTIARSSQFKNSSTVQKERKSITVENSRVSGIVLDGNEENIQFNAPYSCDCCELEFPDQASLAEHQAIRVKPFVCSECDAQFSSKGNLLVHFRRHTGEKPFSCTLCTSCFTTKGNLKRHIKTHSGEKPFKCLQCGTHFTENKSLKVHMRRHTGEKPYQCKTCGKKFAQSGILQTHVAMHLNEKTHLCEHCGKSFRQKSQLRLHMLRHEGVKRFLCLSCPARFLTRGDLDRHSRTHTGERPFTCELCGRRFTRQQSLNEHTNRHYGLKPYKCKICEKTFAEMSACYKHEKLHEKVSTIETAEQKPQSEKEALSSSTFDVSSSPDTDPAHDYIQLESKKFPLILENSETTKTNTKSNSQDQNCSVTSCDRADSENLENSGISDFASIGLLTHSSIQE